MPTTSTTIAWTTSRIGNNRGRVSGGRNCCGCRAKLPESRRDPSGGFYFTIRELIGDGAFRSTFRDHEDFFPQTMSEDSDDNAAPAETPAAKTARKRPSVRKTAKARPAAETDAAPAAEAPAAREAAPAPEPAPERTPSASAGESVSAAGEGVSESHDAGRIAFLVETPAGEPGGNSKKRRRRKKKHGQQPQQQSQHPHAVAPHGEAPATAQPAEQASEARFRPSRQEGVEDFPSRGRGRGAGIDRRSRRPGDLPPLLPAGGNLPRRSRPQKPLTLSMRLECGDSPRSPGAQANCSSSFVRRATSR